MNTQIEEAIKRIQHMESLFDALKQAWNENPAALHTDTLRKEQLATLIHYYENGLWLADYALDEQGLLPKTVKRGVLSQDALYDFLTNLQKN